jgi:hypothetical protein
VLAAVVLASAALSVAAPSPGFRMPSGNVGCVAGPGAMRCDILSGLRPEPRGRCELDWTGLTLSPTGRAQPACAGDTVFNPRFPVLAYGRTWTRAGFVCISRRTGLECRNRQRHGFVLAREGWRRL